jgi:hypothetical protein
MNHGLSVNKQVREENPLDCFDVLLRAAIYFTMKKQTKTRVVKRYQKTANVRAYKKNPKINIT